MVRDKLIPQLTDLTLGSLGNLIGGINVIAGRGVMGSLDNLIGGINLIVGRGVMGLLDNLIGGINLIVGRGVKLIVGRES